MMTPKATGSETLLLPPLSLPLELELEPELEIELELELVPLLVSSGELLETSEEELEEESSESSESPSTEYPPRASSDLTCAIGDSSKACKWIGSGSAAGAATTAGSLLCS